MKLPSIAQGMRRACAILLFFPFFFFCFTVHAANWYVSAAGNDGNDGQSAATPWQTLGRVNSAVLNPGDQVLLHRGDIFYGSLRPATSGISFDAYGVGARPVITGLQEVGPWTDAGGGIYSAACPSCGAVVNMVVVNGVPQGMGRYPNLSDPGKGYLTYESFNYNDATTDIITDNQPGGTDWTGAQVVVRRNNWVLDRGVITQQSGGSITFATRNPYPLNAGFGYFIQNDVRTLDQPGEWYYNAAAGKLLMFFGSGGPGGYVVQASSVDTLVIVSQQSNISFTNLDFTGANKAGFYLNHADNIQLLNSSILYSGVDALIADYPVKNLSVGNDSIVYANNCAINCLYNATTGLTVKNNFIANIGLIPGMGVDYNGVVANGPGLDLENNTIRNIGYDAIAFNGSPATVQNNYLDSFTLVVDDGGGIYTGANQPQRSITGNIVINGIGAPEGTTSTVAANTAGIYGDDDSHNLVITGNTVAHCSRSGILLHNAASNTANNNVLYDNGIEMELSNDNPAYASLRNNTVTGNLLFNKSPGQYALSIGSLNNDFDQTGALDANYFAGPIDSNGIIRTSWAGNTRYYNLSLWQSVYPGFDQHSLPSAVNVLPYTINSVSGSNLFPNGGFDNNINNAWSDFGGSGSYSWSASGIDGGSYYVNANGHVNSYFSVSGVQAGTAYRIRLSARATATNLVCIRFMQNGGSYTSFGVSKYFEVGPQRQDYEYVFVSPASMASAYLIATVESQSGDMYFDNISMMVAGARLTNPGDSLLLAADTTTQALHYPLLDQYKDVQANSYYSYVALQPYASAVLIKKPLLVDLPITTASGDTVRTAQDAAYVSLYPNPVVGSLFVRAVGETYGKLMLTVYDAEGRAVVVSPVVKDQRQLVTTLDLSGQPTGSYFLEIGLPNGKRSGYGFVKGGR